MRNNLLWIDNLRVISIIFVVLLHVSSYGVVNFDVHLDDWMISNIFDSISRWAVPVFFMISGFLLLDINKDDTLSEFYKKRVFKIVLPLIIWTIFFMIFQFIKLMYKDMSFNFYDNVIYPLYLGEPYYHLWFIYTIIVLYLITPFVKYFLNKSKVKHVFSITIILLLLSILYNLQNYTKSFFLIESLKYLPYFLLGYLYRFVPEKKSLFYLACLFFLVSLFVTIYFTYILHIENFDFKLYFYTYLSITTVPMSISIFYIFLYIKPNFIKEKYSKLVLGVYLVHPIFIDFLFLIKLDIGILAAYISIPIFTLVILLFSSLFVVFVNKISFLKKINIF